MKEKILNSNTLKQLLFEVWRKYSQKNTTSKSIDNFKRVSRADCDSLAAYFGEVFRPIKDKNKKRNLTISGDEVLLPNLRKIHFSNYTFS